MKSKFKNFSKNEVLTEEQLKNVTGADTGTRLIVTGGTCACGNGGGMLPDYIHISPCNGVIINTFVIVH